MATDARKAPFYRQQPWEADAQTSEVGVTLEPLNVRPSNE
jgi:hypothetical protein